MYLNQYNHLGSEIGFRQKVICNYCDTEFLEQPSSCPVCNFVIETKTKINNMKTEDEYYEIKHSIMKNLQDSIPKFDLYNMINRKAKELSLKD